MVVGHSLPYVFILTSVMSIYQPIPYKYLIMKLVNSILSIIVYLLIVRKMLYYCYINTKDFITSVCFDD
jgi:hypothetical protein